MSTFAEVLKELRKKREITQSELAKILGVSGSTIAMYETGKREPDFETLEAIADYFNVDIDFLLGKAERSTYYTNPETAEIAQKLFNEPGLRFLFDATKDLSPEDLKYITYIAERMNRERYNTGD